jgi:hypothetical protein
MSYEIQKSTKYTVKVKDAELRERIQAEIANKGAESLRKITKNTKFIIYDQKPNLTQEQKVREIPTIEAKNVKISKETIDQLTLVGLVGNWASKPSTQKMGRHTIKVNKSLNRSCY